MFIPVGTDAPLYHRPWSTVGLIILNGLVFVMVWLASVAEGGLSDDTWILLYGQGLHPHQWLTSAFVHSGLMHLVGNMVFLWVFGLVVEGKLGWWRFLLLYLGISVLSCAIEQTLMLGYQGPMTGSVGASQVIFGLMGVALIWAPENEVEIAWLFSFGIFLARIGSFSIRIRTLALLYFGWEWLLWWLGDFSMSSAALHLLGAVVGLAAGLVLLRLGWVDCENWDLLTLWKKRFLPAARWTMQMFSQRNQSPEVPRRTPQQWRDAFRRHLQGKNFLAAWHSYARLRLTEEARQLTAEELRQLAEGLYHRRCWKETATVLKDMLQRNISPADRIRLRLAAIAVEVEHRPRYALQLLEEIDPSRLASREQRQWQRIRRAASRMIRQGIVEVQAEE